MAELDEIWIPLVDEPIGRIVAQIQRENPSVGTLVLSPRRTLAFRTFAYIRVGILLGRMLVDENVRPYDGTETWVDRLLADPEHRAAVEREVLAVAEQVASDPAYTDEDAPGAGELLRERFREFARALPG